MAPVHSFPSRFFAIAESSLVTAAVTKKRGERHPVLLVRNRPGSDRRQKGVVEAQEQQREGQYRVIDPDHPEIQEMIAPTIPAETQIRGTLLIHLHPTAGGSK